MSELHLAPARLRVVRVAIGLGWVSVAVVVTTALLEGGPALVWALAGAAAAGNTALALLPWSRLMGGRAGEAVLRAWSVGLVLLIAALTWADGGWRSEHYLLAFLVIPFVALTEPREQQVVLYALLLLAYLGAVLLVPDPPPPGVLVARLGVLAAASALAAVVAEVLRDGARARARAESEARMERLLADEAHHRIKNNLQLVADLLTLEAANRRDLDTVVAETLSRIASVAAVHQALARRGEGRVELRPVLERIVGLLADRLGSGRHVRVHVEDAELPGDRATWIALAVTELVTNALRHGQGAVALDVARSWQGLELRVADEGPGPDEHATPGLGEELVERLVEGLHGKVERCRTDAGWTVLIAIPHEEDVPHARADR
jgi:two-component sensor histidine kinase